jgi:hypothetical protein
MFREYKMGYSKINTDGVFGRLSSSFCFKVLSQTNMLSREIHHSGTSIMLPYCFTTRAATEIPQPTYQLF